MKKISLFISVLVIAIGLSGCGSGYQGIVLKTSEYNKYPVKAKIPQDINCDGSFKFRFNKNDVYPVFSLADKKLLDSNITFPPYALGVKVFEMLDRWNFYILINDKGERLFDNYLIAGLAEDTSKGGFIQINMVGDNHFCTDKYGNKIDNFKVELIEN